MVNVARARDLESLALRGEIVRRGRVHYEPCAPNEHIAKKTIWTVAAALRNEEATPVRRVETKLNTVTECSRNTRRYARAGVSDTQSRRCLAGSPFLVDLVLLAATVAFRIVAY